MQAVSKLQNYRDERGNETVYSGAHAAKAVGISFSGGGNRLVIDPDADISRLYVEFRGHDAEISICGGGYSSWRIIVGSRSKVSIGRQTTTTGIAYMTALEGSSIEIGRDCMLAGDVQIRADDAHAIFDVATGDRANKAAPIIIGDHVWLGQGCVILGGSELGTGSVVGTRSVVKCKAPNNCVLAGVPARVVRKNMAWERPYLGHEHLFDPDGDPKEFTKEFWGNSEDD